MGRSGFGSRVAGSLLAGILLAFLVPAAASAGLSKPERKAVDIASIDAESTGDAAFAEIGFKGGIEEELGTGGLKRARVTIELVSSSGPTTVITDEKASRKPREGRSGTDGRFEVVRNGRTILLLVEDLPVPVTQILVTTSGPAGASGRGDPDVVPEDFDKLAQEARAIDSSEKAEFARERWGERRDNAEKDLEKAERDAEKTVDAIDRAQRDLNSANTGGQAREARERIKKFKDKLAKLNQRRKTLRANIKILETWLRNLQLIAGGGTLEQCSDHGDNGDPEDTIADHPDDPGCVTPTDNDEKDVEVPLTCPAPGGSTSPFAVINTPQSNGFTSVRLSKAGTGELVLDGPVQGESAGPAPFPVDICGPQFNETFQWVIFQDGTPYSLPDPPPGEHGICIFIEVENPMGSGNLGGQNVPVRFAVGTAPQ